MPCDNQRGNTGLEPTAKGPATPFSRRPNHSGSIPHMLQPPFGPYSARLKKKECAARYVCSTRRAGWQLGPRASLGRSRTSVDEPMSRFPVSPVAINKEDGVSGLARLAAVRGTVSATVHAAETGNRRYRH